MTKKWIKGAIVAGAMMAATPSFAATTIATADLSATNAAASSFTYTFAPGDYTVSLIQGAYSAWAPARTGVAADGTSIVGTNWTDYYKYTINGVTSYFYPLNGQRFNTAAAAFAAYSAVDQLSLNFLTSTSVTFAIADTSYGDNSGGVSLAIAAVPETATWMMMLAGFGIIGFALRGAPRRNGAMTTA